MWAVAPPVAVCEPTTGALISCCIRVMANGRFEDPDTMRVSLALSRQFDLSRWHAATGVWPACTHVLVYVHIFQNMYLITVAKMADVIISSQT